MFALDQEPTFPSTQQKALDTFNVCPNISRLFFWFRQLRSEPALKAILALLIFIAAVIGHLTAPSAHSLQSRLSFALLMASLIIGTY
jgi:hypothetical protein